MGAETGRTADRPPERREQVGATGADAADRAALPTPGQSSRGKQSRPQQGRKAESEER